MDFNDETLWKIVERWLSPIDLLNFRISNISEGLSGAQLWKVTCGEQTYCLRRWPTVHPTDEELSEIHSLIAHAWKNGFTIVPLPQHTRSGQSFVSSAGHLWELALWLVGENAENLTAQQTDAALTALARFHRIASSHAIVQSGSAPGLIKRSKILKQLRDTLLAQLEQAIRVAPQTPHRELALTMLNNLRQVLSHVIEIVEQASTTSYPLQWCLRDIHRGNLLFSNDQVTGLVDFGAASIDSVAGDVARLVGSIAGEDPQIWQTCLATYARIHLLTDEELTAIAAYDIGGLVASSANWLRWLFVEHREFADSQAVQTQLSELAKRLRSLAERGGRGVIAVSQGFEM